MNTEKLSSNTNYLSGQGKNSAVPSEIKKWSWGAFWLNWVWGINNRTYIALLMFLPLVNIVMMFVLGAKGNQWAWQNKEWKDIEHFKRIQKKWAITGWLIVVVVIPLFIVLLNSILKGEAYEESLSLLRSNKNVVEFVGKPIEPSYFVTGEYAYRNGDSTTILKYSIIGSKREASVYVSGHKNHQWIFDKAIVYNKEEKVKINLLKE